MSWSVRKMKPARWQPLTANGVRANRLLRRWPVCDKCHSNAELTVVRVFQTAFAEEKRYVDVDQVRCVFGTYRGHHRTYGFALSDNSVNLFRRGLRRRPENPQYQNGLKSRGDRRHVRWRVVDRTQGRRSAPCPPHLLCSAAACFCPGLPTSGADLPKNFRLFPGGQARCLESTSSASATKNRTLVG